MAGVEVALNVAKALYFVRDLDNLWLLRDSPHVVPIYGWCSYKGDLAYVTRWIEDGEMRWLAARPGFQGGRGHPGRLQRMEQSEGRRHLRLQLARSLLRAVAYFHERTPVGAPMLLCDFGTHQMLVDGQQRVRFHDVGLNSFEGGCGMMGRPGHTTADDMHHVACVLLQLMGYAAECARHRDFVTLAKFPPIEDIGPLAMLPYGPRIVRLLRSCLGEAEARPSASELTQQFDRIAEDYDVVAGHSCDGSQVV